MTDGESHEMAQMPDSGGGAAAGGGAAGMMSKMSPGETLVFFGAVVVLGGWVVFDLLLDEYGPDAASFALAIFIVVAGMSGQRRTGAAVLPQTTVLYVAGGILGILGAAFLVEEVRDGVLGAGFLTVIGALVYYAGAILAGVGAFQLRK